MNRLFTFEEEDGLVFEVPLPPKIERAIRLTGLGLTLRRLSADEERYDPTGSFFESVVTLPNHAATALKELTGFHADELIGGGYGGSIGYQLSVDGGTSWLALDDTLPAWVPAVGPFAGVYVSAALVEEFIAAAPLQPVRQIRVRARLSPSADGKRRPALRAVAIDLEYDYDFQTDLARSVKHHVEALVRVRSRWVDNVTGGTTVVVDSGMTVSAPVEVYNLTTDPDRTTNLFVVVAPDGKTVTFAPAQTGKVEVNYVGRPKVFIAAEENYQLGTIPAVLIDVPTVTDRPEHAASATNEAEYDVNRRTFEARRRNRRSIFDVQVTLGCQATFKEIALALSDAVEKALDPRRRIVSEAIGERYAILAPVTKTRVDQVAQSLFVTNVALRLGGHAWLRPEYDVLTVSKKVITTVRPADGPEADVPAEGPSATVGGAAGLGLLEQFVQEDQS